MPQPAKPLYPSVPSPGRPIPDYNSKHADDDGFTADTQESLPVRTSFPFVVFLFCLSDKKTLTSIEIRDRKPLNRCLLFFWISFSIFSILSSRVSICLPPPFFLSLFLLLLLFFFCLLSSFCSLCQSCSSSVLL